MPAASVEAIADAVLYEGYILYPYRPALKNRQRWTFGGLYPRAYSEAHGGSDAWSLQAECLVIGNPATRLDVNVRFLHLIDRTAGEFAQPLACWPDDREPEFRPVPTLHVGGRQFPAWQEAAEREARVQGLEFARLLGAATRRRFAFPGSRAVEPVADEDGEIRGVLVRQQLPIEGVVEIAAHPVDGQAFRVTVCVRNETSLEDAGQKTRDEALLRSLVSTHAVLTVRDGEFLSLMDPPETYREAAAGCRNVGLWPVLAGDEGRRDTMLASPIILYDYPQVAPESPGDLFDGTEIDELLTLRILTLTDEEKLQMAAVDPRTKLLLERTEALAREQLLGLHGAVQR